MALARTPKRRIKERGIARGACLFFGLGTPKVQKSGNQLCTPKEAVSLRPGNPVTSDASRVLSTREKESTGIVRSQIIPSAEV